MSRERALFRSFSATRQRRTDLPRSAHHRGSRRWRQTTAILRTTRVMPRPHHHSLSAPRRHDRSRSHRQIRRRILPRHPLSATTDTPAWFSDADPLHFSIPPKSASHFRFPSPLQNAGSGTGKSIGFGDQSPIKQRDRAQWCRSGNLTDRPSRTADWVICDCIC